MMLPCLLGCAGGLRTLTVQYIVAEILRASLPTDAAQGEHLTVRFDHAELGKVPRGYRVATLQDSPTKLFVEARCRHGVTACFRLGMQLRRLLKDTENRTLRNELRSKLGSAAVLVTAGLPAVQSLAEEDEEGKSRAPGEGPGAAPGGREGSFNWVRVALPPLTWVQAAFLALVGIAGLFLASAEVRAAGGGEDPELQICEVVEPPDHDCAKIASEEEESRRARSGRSPRWRIPTEEF